MDQFKKEIDQIKTPDEWKDSLLLKIEEEEQKKKKPFPYAYAYAAAALLLFAAGTGIVLNQSSRTPSPVAAVNETEIETPFPSQTESSKSYHAAYTDLGEEGAAGGAGYTEITEWGEGEGGPAEYFVSHIVFEEGAVKQTGPVNLYEYERMLSETDLPNRIGSIYHTNLTSDHMCSPETVAGGYDNYSGDVADENQTGVYLSCNVYTGKFSLNNSYTEDYYRSLVDSFHDYELSDYEEIMYESAKSFADQFSDITGSLTLSDTQDYEFGFVVTDPDTQTLWQVSLTGLTYRFTSEYSSIKLEAQDELALTGQSMDSSVPDPDVQYFNVTVLPDGNIVYATNYISSAPIISTGTMEMFDIKTDAERLASYITSTAENDTMIVKDVSLSSYSNYFGSLPIDPTVTVTYSYESDPENVQKTVFVLYGLK